THSLDPARVQELITKKTKAIMPLHFAGIVGQIDAIHEIAHRMNVRIVEDATHALGSIHHGKAIGSGGDITCFSFDPVKIITSIDGGAVICSREEDIAQIHRWRLLGVDKDTTLRYQNKRAWEYDVTCEGWRDHMTNINAAIGLSQLARLDEFLASRRRDCATYNEAFADLQWLRVPDVNWKNVGPFIYTVRVLHGQREAFMAHLRERGVATGIHFLPLHEMTFCKDFRHGPMKVTQRVSAEIVTLPLWSQMPTDIRDLVIDAVRSYEPVEAMASGAR
ncbi:MAG TPA: DegT/DnrJ/EryC1/StrS family aminotransferase, partial [Phycisphaerales bacterium]|nr:DegT/DnrJ/EryC1/StrS family aminotransferase [Phycisphaerales bacterium]